MYRVYWTAEDGSARSEDYVEMVAALTEADVKERFKQLGLIAVGNTPEEFREFVRRDVEKCRQIVKESGIPLL